MNAKWTRVSDAINQAIDELRVQGCESHACAMAEDKLTEAIFWTTVAAREDEDGE